MSDGASRDALLERLNLVFHDVFDDDSIVIGEDTTAEYIDDWDSLMHITLVLAVESEFDIRLKAAEVGKLENVGALLDILQERNRN